MLRKMAGEEAARAAPYVHPRIGFVSKVHSPVMLNCRSSQTWCAPCLWCLWRASRACAPGAQPDHSISGALPLQFTVCAAIADHHANNTDRKWQETRLAYWRNSQGLSRGRPRLPATFYMKTMVPLRIIGICSNCTFIMYGVSWRHDKKYRRHPVGKYIRVLQHNPPESGH